MLADLSAGVMFSNLAGLPSCELKRSPALYDGPYGCLLESKGCAFINNITPKSLEIFETVKFVIVAASGFTQPVQTAHHITDVLAEIVLH